MDINYGRVKNNVIIPTVYHGRKNSQRIDEPNASTDGWRSAKPQALQ